MSNPKESVSDLVNRVRSQKAPFGNPMKPVVHRVRNEATEKEMSELPWCGAERPSKANGETILDCDVTCPLCLALIDKRKGNREARVLPPLNSKIRTHFPAWDAKTLCGLVFGEYDHQADTLRETGCEECQKIAEELIIDYMPAAQQSKPNTIKDAYEEQNAALRDIAESLKTIAASVTLWIEK